MAMLWRNPQTSRPAFPTRCLSVPGALGGQPPAPPSGTRGFRTKPPTGTLMTADRRPPTPRRSKHTDRHPSSELSLLLATDCGRAAVMGT